MKSLYKAWPGRNRFLPWGCIIGPIQDTCANLYVYCCFIGALIPYCIFVLPKIWLISPAIPILFLICLVITVLFLILTQCSDPGIIPRRPYLEREASKFQRYLIEGQPNEGDLVQKRNFCETCKIFRPRRASHCSTCQNCVQVFDHHCPFVNNCIGKRNYRFFVLFLAGIVLSMIAFLVNLIIFGINMAGTQINSMVVIILCSIAAGIVGIPLLGFLIFHIFLAVTGKTTRQIIKNINEEPQQNQWCKVDPPLMDYFQEINESSFKLLQRDLQDLVNFNQQTILNQIPVVEDSTYT